MEKVRACRWGVRAPLCTQKKRKKKKLRFSHRFSQVFRGQILFAAHAHTTRTVHATATLDASARRLSAPLCTHLIHCRDLCDLCLARFRACARLPARRPRRGSTPPPSPARARGSPPARRASTAGAPTGAGRQCISGATPCATARCAAGAARAARSLAGSPSSAVLSWRPLAFYELEFLKRSSPSATPHSANLPPRVYWQTSMGAADRPSAANAATGRWLACERGWLAAHSHRKPERSASCAIAAQQTPAYERGCKGVASYAASV